MIILSYFELFEIGIIVSIVYICQIYYVEII